LPRYAASRTLPAAVEDVWAVLAEPVRLAEWWPGVEHVDPGRRGLVAGARWYLRGPFRPSLLRRPEMTGELLVLEAEAPRRLVFRLLSDRIDAELELAAAGGDATEATLVIDVPWLIGMRRNFPSQALSRLAGSVRQNPE
jgi:uncharacterized protein YndB with AHSA1/START domain